MGPLALAERVQGLGGVRRCVPEALRSVGRFGVAFVCSFLSVRPPRNYSLLFLSCLTGDVLVDASGRNLGLRLVHLLRSLRTLCP